MLKRVLLSILMGIVVIGIIVLSYIFIISPGINKINESNSIVEVTGEEKVEKEKEINEKYTKLELEIEQKYDDLERELDIKYTNLEAQIRDKYAKLEKELESKATIKMGQDGWYEQQTQLSKDKVELHNKQSAEDSNLWKEKTREESSLRTKKYAELNSLDSQKDAELSILESRPNEKLGLKTKGVFYIVVGSIVDIVVLAYIIGLFNTLIRRRNKVKESLSQIDVMLKKRTDLIPNFVEVVKGYTKHEKDTLEKVTKARSNIINSKNVKEEMKASDELTSNINKIFVLAEKYPELKANENFLNLQTQLTKIEEDIAFERMNYNRNVLWYKNKIGVFPSNIVAIICNFKEEAFYDISDSEKENVKVKI